MYLCLCGFDPIQLSFEFTVCIGKLILAECVSIIIKKYHYNKTQIK